MSKLVLVLGCICALLHGGTSADTLNTVTLEQAQADPRGTFALWVQEHAKLYQHDVEEYPKRFALWLRNMEHVAEHAAKQSTMQLGLNRFADMTEAEFRAAYLGYTSRRNPLLTADKVVGIEEYRYRHITPPKEVDWRKSGVVGPVKDQHVNGAPCGCCWAFATTGITECINAMYTGEMVAVSEQQLIDCDHAKPFEDLGCEGGDFTGGMQYIINNGGIDTEEDYPYMALDAKCAVKKEGRRVVTLDAWESVPPGNETALMQAVSQHPVAVGMCCGDYLDVRDLAESVAQDWHAYKGGIFDSPCCEAPIDHAVVVVGYGTEDGQDYWLVKNSWGTHYGEDGFIRFKRGLGGFGQCSIAHEPAYAIKTHPNPTPLDVPTALTLVAGGSSSGGRSADA